MALVAWDVPLVALQDIFSQRHWEEFRSLRSRSHESPLAPNRLKLIIITYIWFAHTTVAQTSKVVMSQLLFLSLPLDAPWVAVYQGPNANFDGPMKKGRPKPGSNSPLPLPLKLLLLVNIIFANTWVPDLIPAWNRHQMPT